MAGAGSPRVPFSLRGMGGLVWVPVTPDAGPGAVGCCLLAGAPVPESRPENSWKFFLGAPLPARKVSDPATRVESRIED